jgi:hypothetical protein
MVMHDDAHGTRDVLRIEAELPPDSGIGSGLMHGINSIRESRAAHT